MNLEPNRIMGAGDWITLGGIVVVQALAVGGWMFRMSSDLREIKTVLKSTEKNVGERHQENIVVQKEIWTRITDQERRLGRHAERLAVIETTLRIKSEKGSDE